MENKFKELYENMEFGERTVELENFLGWLTQQLSTEEAKELCEILLPEMFEENKENDEESDTAVDENKTKESSRVIYTHNCHGSAKHHMRKYKHWCKLVKSVDTNKTNGYAFIGDFLSLNTENLVPVDSIVVEVCGNDYTAYRIVGDNDKKEVASGTKSNLVTFIREVANYV